MAPYRNTFYSLSSCELNDMFQQHRDHRQVYMIHLHCYTSWPVKAVRVFFILIIISSNCVIEMLLKLLKHLLRSAFVRVSILCFLVARVFVVCVSMDCKVAYTRATYRRPVTGYNYIYILYMNITTTKYSTKAIESLPKRLPYNYDEASISRFNFQVKTNTFNDSFSR
jgi:hypothetical protein